VINIDGLDYLSREEIASSIGCSHDTVDRLFIRGRLDKFEFLGGQVLARADQVEAFKIANLRLVSARKEESIA
jgi:excisionase family DNA binding protein